MRMTGMSRVSGSVLSACSTCQPSAPGMTMSRVMASGWSSRAFRSPSSPPAGGDDGVARVGEILLEQVYDIRIVVDGKHDFTSQLGRERDGPSRGLRLRFALRRCPEPLQDV